MQPAPTLDPAALRLARLRAGLTQSDLARLVGVAGGERISKWELGTATPRATSIRHLAGALNLHPADLLTAGGVSDLRRLRLHRGLTGREVAAKAHIALPTLLRWEVSGLRRRPHLKTLRALATALGVSTTAVENALDHSNMARVIHTPHGVPSVDPTSD